MKFRSCLLFLCLSMLVACQCTSYKHDKSIIHKNRIDQALNSLVKDNTLVGVSALVYQGDKEAYFGAFGMADKEKAQPIQRDTLVQIYSMTKPVTGVVLMSLYEEGKFRLDDPIAKYIPEFANLKVFAGTDASGNILYEKPKREITVLDIMRHTAGWTQWGKDNEQPITAKMWAQYDPFNHNNSLSKMAEQLAKIPLLFQPGSRWYYGPSVDIQALLAERLSGVPYEKLLQTRVLDPLQMVDTGYYIPESKRNRLSAMYKRADDGTMVPEPESTYHELFAHWPLTQGGAGLVSTLDDYMRFARMLQNDGELDGVRILQPDTIKLMSSDFMPKDVTDKSWLPSKGQVGFGLDFAVRIAPPKDASEASGAVGEFFWDGFANTLFFVDPKNNITAVLFNYYVPFGNTPVHKNFRDAIYSSIPEARAPTQ